RAKIGKTLPAKTSEPFMEIMAKRPELPFTGAMLLSYFGLPNWTGNPQRATELPTRLPTASIVEAALAEAVANSPRRRQLNPRAGWGARLRALIEKANNYYLENLNGEKRLNQNESILAALTDEVASTQPSRRAGLTEAEAIALYAYVAGHPVAALSRVPR